MIKLNKIHVDLINLQWPKIILFYKNRIGRHSNIILQYNSYDMHIWIIQYMQSLIHTYDVDVFPFNSIYIV